MVCISSATPPMRRKPCEGRNVEDSEADLYLEYHGPDPTVPSRSCDLDLSSPADTTPQIRQRKMVEMLVHAAERTEKKEDIFENCPDLKPTIDVNFSHMCKRSVSFSETEDVKDKTDVNSGGSKEDICSKSSIKDNQYVVGENENLSKGYDFSGKFCEIYSDHEKFLQEKKQHEKQLSAWEDLDKKNRSKSWSEGMDVKIDIRLFLLSLYHRLTFVFC